MIKKFFKDAAFLSMTDIILRLKSLIFIPFLTKTFGSVDYGIWAQVAIIVAMASPIVVMGTDGAMMRFVPGKEREYSSKAISTEIFYLTNASLLFGVIFFFLSSYISKVFLGGIENSNFVKLCGYVLLVTVLLTICKHWYRIQDKVKSYSAINLSHSFLTLMALGCILFFKKGIYELVLFTTTVELILLLILIIHISIKWGFVKPDKSILIKFLRFGFPIFPTGYAMWILNASDRLFLGYYGTIGDIGVYSVVYSFGYTLINLLFNPIFLMYAPRVTELYSKNELKKISVLFNYSTKVALGLLIPSIVGITLLSKLILTILTTSEFIRGAPLVPIITLSYLFLMMGSYFDVSLGLVYKQKWTTINLFLAAIINILLNFVLIPKFGIIGAAISTCISFGILMILAMIISHKHVYLEFDFKFLLKTIISSFIMGAFVKILNPNDLFNLILTVLFGTIIFSTLMVILRAANPKEIKIILKHLRLKSLMGNKVICKVLGI